MSSEDPTIATSDTLGSMFINIITTRSRKAFTIENTEMSNIIEYIGLKLFTKWKMVTRI